MAVSIKHWAKILNSRVDYFKIKAEYHCAIKGDWRILFLKEIDSIAFCPLCKKKLINWNINEKGVYEWG